MQKEKKEKKASSELYCLHSTMFPLKCLPVTERFIMRQREEKEGTF